MSAQVWPGGLVQGVNGPDLVTLPNCYLSSQALFLDNSQSSANDSNAGTNPELPVRSLSHAISLLGDAGTLVVGASHNEAISAGLTLAVDATIIGCVAGAVMPRFVNNCTSGSMLSLTSRCRLSNLLFPASSASGGTAKVALSISPYSVVLRGCRFEQGAADVTGCLINTAYSPRIEHCTFVATGALPSAGVLVGGAVDGVSVEDCVFDGGLPSYGWANYAFRTNSFALTALWMKNVLFQRGSGASISSGSTYQFFNVTSSEGGVPIYFR